MGPHTIKAAKRFIRNVPELDLCHVLDVGGADVNGSMRHLFNGALTYTTCDIHGGPNVDVVLNGSLEQTFVRKFDVITCCDVLEHVKDPWNVVRDMASILRLGGYLFILAPFAWPEHRHPFDCYRFAPDGLEHMAQSAGLTVRECYLFRSSKLPPFSLSPLWLYWLHAKLWINPKLWLSGKSTGYMHTALTAVKEKP